MKNIRKTASSCVCSLCGEKLTAPVFYNGMIYGYSCVKKVKPDFKKPKIKPYWIQADSFTLEIIGKTTTKIIAKHDFLNKRFTDTIHTWVNIVGETLIRSNIQLVDNVAYINLLDYTNGEIYIQKIERYEPNI